jgi:dehydrogenase/reductase SDR family protein 7B
LIQADPFSYYNISNKSPGNQITGTHSCEEVGFISYFYRQICILMNYKGKTVWITGASSGIGAALARLFAREGARVIISSHEAEELEGVRRDLEPVSRDVHSVVFNLGYPEEVKAAAMQVLEQFGRIDVLMNNGGISTRAEALETPLEIDRRVMEIDYFSGVILAKAVLPGMIANGYGHIGVTSSLSGKHGWPLRSAYAAAKFALFGFYESLLMENRSKGIRVTLFSPSRVRTNISLHALEKDGREHGKMDPRQLKGVTPEKCARIMIRAMKKNRTDVLIGGWELISVRVHGLSRRLFYRLARKFSVN